LLELLYSSAVLPVVASSAAAVLVAMTDRRFSRSDLRIDAVSAVGQDGRMLVFEEQDAAYLAWLGVNPAGYVINAFRPPKPDSLRLHRATCSKIKGVPANGSYWTQTRIKVCGHRDELEEWASREVGGEVWNCPLCM
jgi:hypothetical protein